MIPLVGGSVLFKRYLDSGGDFDLHMSAKWFIFASGLPHEDKGEVASLRDLTLLL